jgi:Aldo/keto reductase family
MSEPDPRRALALLAGHDQLRGFVRASRITLLPAKRSRRLLLLERCLGTMNFGAFTAAADAHQIMDRALESGINFFDTSNTYGRPRAEGVTEQVIGDWLGQGGGRRDRVVLATKVYGGKGEWPNDEFLSAVGIRRPVTTRCAGSGPTGSTCTRCTTWIGPRRGRRSGRR